MEDIKLGPVLMIQYFVILFEDRIYMYAYKDDIRGAYMYVVPF